jgi:predicted RNA-binding protein with PUA-like domain
VAGRRRQLKLVRPGDRVLCYHGTPERALYAIALVTRAPYPDPLDPAGKNQVIDLRAMERLPRQLKLSELKQSRELRKLKFLKDVRQPVSPVADAEYEAILRLAGIVTQLGIPLP